MSRQSKAPRRSGWSPTMEKQASLEGRQVKCLIASEGHLWMRGYFDRLPPAVRHRLADSPFNICAACLYQEASGNRSVAAYFALIEQIEDTLRDPPGASMRAKHAPQETR